MNIEDVGELAEADYYQWSQAEIDRLGRERDALRTELEALREQLSDPMLAYADLTDARAELEAAKKRIEDWGLFCSKHGEQEWAYCHVCWEEEHAELEAVRAENERLRRDPMTTCTAIVSEVCATCGYHCEDSFSSNIEFQHRYKPRRCGHEESEHEDLGHDGHVACRPCTEANEGEYVCHAFTTAE